MLTEIKPDKGKILISEPFLADPNFSRAVIIIAEKSNEGSLGFVLNNKSSLILSDVIQNNKIAEIPIFIGGPVEIDNLFFIHKSPFKELGEEVIVDNLCWGDNFDVLIHLLENNKIKTEDFKLFLGYSGWEKQQLEHEVEENSWLVSNKFNSQSLLLLDGNELWKQMLSNLGEKYAHLRNFPISPNLN